MYTTKSLSEFKATPEAALQMPTPEGPNSGYLVIDEDDVHEEISNCCWGLRRDSIQAKRVLFVPVMNVPLAANRYYVVVAEGKHKGLVNTCSREEDMTTCCFSQIIEDVEPKPFDHRDIYQQIEIILDDGLFTAKSVASDGFPPRIFREKYWISYEEDSNYQLDDAFGLNNAVRSKILNLDLEINFIAGMWYCPFIFVKEAGKWKDQMKKSLYYQVILEQFWQKGHSGIENKKILLRGGEIMKEEKKSSDGFVWFKKIEDLNGERIGLSLALWERIKWEENRNGWDEGVGSTKEEVKIGGFVLVERFSIKRLDGSVALALDFIHTGKVRTS